jgi:hypothetical protein
VNKTFFLSIAVVVSCWYVVIILPDFDAFENFKCVENENIFELNLKQ